jgi:hypothetical protein
MTVPMNDDTRWMQIPIAQLRPAPWNYKVDDDFLAKRLEANIRRNGQVENLIVRELGDGTFEVVNGNHRLVTFRALGMAEAMCYNVGTVAVRDAQRLAIETNETKFASDPFLMADLVQEVLAAEQYDGVEADPHGTLPFSDEEFETIAAMSGKPEWLQPGPKAPGPPSSSDKDSGKGSKGPKQNPADALVCPACGHAFWEAPGGRA